ncbi:MAG: carbohydrate kinase family protein [Acidobacteriota bacterium]|nr:carbohydrate kinase family protein [Acidobacteriota bacterium]
MAVFPGRVMPGHVMPGHVMDALIAGDLFVDLILTGFASWPAPGEEAFATGLHREAGGGAAITAHGLAKLGVHTGVVGTVGSSDGEWLIDRFRQLGVDSSAIRKDPGRQTGLTVAVSDAHERAFFTYAGANHGTARILEWEPLPQARHVHLACVPTLRMLERLRQENYSVSIDVGWHPEWLANPANAQVVRLADICFPNEREAQVMRHWIAEIPETMVVIKRGPAGAESVLHGERYTHPGFTIDALDTTGAGDCFDAGFLSAWLQGRPAPECLRVGNACGALSTRATGGISGMPSPTELQEFLCET